MNKQIKTVFVEPNKKAVIKTIDGSLEGMQKAVGGYIQSVPLDGADLICNEEGKLMQLPFNRALTDNDGNIYDFVAGTFFICGAADDDFADIDDEIAQKYMERFLLPEKLIHINGYNIVHRYSP